jgi:hypothetical protein
MKKTVVYRQGRVFDVYVAPIGGGYAEVNIYEVVRPKWKIFRTKFFPFFSTSIFVGDYLSITLALFDCVDAGLRREQRTEEIRKVWEEFQKNS